MARRARVDPNDIVRVSILASLGALSVGVAAALLAFAAGGAGHPGAGGVLAVPVGLAGLAGLALGALLLGGAGLDALAARRGRSRNRGPPPAMPPGEGPP